MLNNKITSNKKRAEIGSFLLCLLMFTILYGGSKPFAPSDEGAVSVAD